MSIADTKYMKHQGKYPVIFIDFKDCKGSSYAEVEHEMQRKIFKTIRNFDFLMNVEGKVKDHFLIRDDYKKLYE